MQGKIIKGIAGFYYIHVETSGIYECKAKGIFRNRHIKPLVGDNVEIEVIDKDNFKGNVVDILPRKNELIRPASANIDQAMVIFAVKTPEPNFNLLDKFILMMNYQDVPTVVCFNKEELADDEYKNELKKKYEGWPTSRLGKTELSIMRLAVYEMLYDEDIPTNVALNEAVELAKKYGSADSTAAFVNGVLGKLIKE